MSIEAQVRFCLPEIIRVPVCIFSDKHGNDVVSSVLAHKPHAVGFSSCLVGHNSPGWSDDCGVFLTLASLESVWEKREII